MSEIKSLNIYFDRISQIIKSCKGEFNFKSATEIADVLNEANESVNKMFQYDDNLSRLIKDLTAGDPASVLEQKLKQNPYLGLVSRNCLFLNIYISDWSSNFHVKYIDSGYKVFKRKEFVNEHSPKKSANSAKSAKSVKPMTLAKKIYKKPNANFESAEAAKKAVPNKKVKFSKKQDNQQEQRDHRKQSKTASIEEIDEQVNADEPVKQTESELVKPTNTDDKKDIESSDLGELGKLDFNRTDEEHSWAD